ncbi:putative membrane protein YesL [Kroppenstedtia sanguinis]
MGDVEFGKGMSRIFNICDWIMKLAIVNLLWLVFTIAGLVIFGVAPATVAMFSVIRKWIMGEEDIPIFKSFWKYYRTDFLKSNLLGLTFFLIGCILYVDLKFALDYEGSFSTVFLVPVILACASYLLTLAYLFPVFVHYEWPGFKQCIQNAFLIGIAQLPSTLLMIGGVFLSYLLFRFMPVTLLFYCASLIGYFLYRSAHRAFLKIERAKAAEEM